MIVRKLVAYLGFDVDTKKLDKFDKSISGLKVKLKDLGKTAKIVTGVLVGTAGAITALTLSSAKSIKVSEKLAKQVGVTGDEFRKLTDAAKVADINTDQLTNGFLRFSTMLGKAKISIKGTSNEFRALGINIKDSSGHTKDTVTLFSEASKKLLALKDPSKQAAISFKLFGTSNLELARFMGQSNEELLKQIEATKALSFEIDHNAVAASKRFVKSWVETKIVMTSLKDVIAIQFMPVINDVLSSFKEWFVINKDLIKQNISTTISVISKTFSALSSIVKLIAAPIIAIVDALGGVESAARLLGATMAVLLIPRILAAATAVKVLTIALLANPIGIVIAAVTALGVAITALVVDDIAAWVSGNASAIGDMLGDWAAFKKDMLGIWGDITEGVKGYLKDLRTFGQVLFDVSALAVSKVSSAIDDAFSSDVKKLIKGDKIKVNTESQNKIVNTVVTKNLGAPSKPSDEPKIITNNDPRQSKVLSAAHGRALLDTPKVSRIINNDIQPQKAPQTKSMGRPVVLPMTSGGMLGSSNVAPVNNVTQSITENITINVPVGTTTEQSRDISMQVAKEVEKQFHTNIIRGLDSISMR